MKNKLSRFAVPYEVWMAIFVVAPILIMVIYAFSSSEGGFTLDNFVQMGGYTQVFLRSFKLAIIATLICLVIGYPVSYLMSREGPAFQRTAMVLIMLPMWMNFMLRILAWKQLLSKNGVINSILTTLGLPGFNIMNTSGAVVLGMVYDFLPFMLLPIYNSMTRTKNDWIEAALDLGANKVTILFKIILPLTISGVISGIVMVFVPSLTSFAISQILGGGKVLLIGNIIEQDFVHGSQWGAGSGLSLVLMVFVLISMALVNLFDKEGVQSGLR